MMHTETPTYADEEVDLDIRIFITVIVTFGASAGCFSSAFLLWKGFYQNALQKWVLLNIILLTLLSFSRGAEIAIIGIENFRKKITSTQSSDMNELLYGCTTLVGVNAVLVLLFFMSSAVVALHYVQINDASREYQGNLNDVYAMKTSRCSCLMALCSIGACATTILLLFFYLDKRFTFAVSDTSCIPKALSIIVGVDVPILIVLICVSVSRTFFKECIDRKLAAYNSLHFWLVASFLVCHLPLTIYYVISHVKGNPNFGYVELASSTGRLQTFFVFILLMYLYSSTKLDDMLGNARGQFREHDSANSLPDSLPDNIHGSNRNFHPNFYIKFPHNVHNSVHERLLNSFRDRFLLNDGDMKDDDMKDDESRRCSAHYPSAPVEIQQRPFEHSHADVDSEAGFKHGSPFRNKTWPLYTPSRSPIQYQRGREGIMASIEIVERLGVTPPVTIHQ